MRAVIYARFSSNNQRDASIGDQVRLCRQYIDRQGWTYLHAFTDRAISGARLLRAGYQKLLEDARAGSYDVVVAEALDRLSRDQEHVAALFKQLSFAGVRIVTLAEGEINELHVGLKGTMNALFLIDLAQKTRRGLEGRVRQGRSAGRQGLRLRRGQGVRRRGQPRAGRSPDQPGRSSRRKTHIRSIRRRAFTPGDRPAAQQRQHLRPWRSAVVGHHDPWPCHPSHRDPAQ